MKEGTEMKLAFICGPYRAGTITEIGDNIQRAKEASKVLWKSGYAVICPHMNSAMLDGLVPDKQFLDAGLLMIEKCDVVFVLKNWSSSEGSKAEVIHAKAKGIEVDYRFVDEVPIR